MPGTITFNLACPRCTAQGTESPLKTTPGRPVYFCDKGHEWNDYEMLISENPQKLSHPLPQKPKPPQPGQTELRIVLHSKLRDLLQQRFGERLNPTAVGILTSMCEAGSFIVSQADVLRLRDHLGLKVRHSDELVGNVYAIRSERDQLRQKVEQLSSGTPQANPAQVASVQNGKVAITIGVDPEIYKKLQEKAAFRGQPVPQCLEETIAYAIANNWL